MSTKKQKFVYVFALAISFALGMLTMSGCAYFSQEKVAGTVSTVLEIAYVSGGATRVEHGGEATGWVYIMTELPEQAKVIESGDWKEYRHG